jgi:peroxiredoxin
MVPGSALSARHVNRIRLAVGLSLALVLIIFTATFMAVPRPIAAQSEDSYESELAKGNDLLRRRRWEDALKSFKKANDLHDKRSVEACLGMVQAYYGLEAYKNVVDTCEKIIELAAGDANTLAEVYNYEGISLQMQANAKDQKKLADAEAVFRKGVALNPNLAILHYNLGFTMMELNRDAEGIVELKKYVSMNPEGSKAEEAARLIANPRRAREAFAPDFSLTTADGEYVTLEDLRGKVVLLDFWGIWCTPCVASVPALRDLQKRFAKEPQFKMISVSTDTNEPKWRDFIEKNQMVWTQYFDRDKHVTHTFDVRAFPTYILLDNEGIVRYREVSTRWERTGDLPDAIKKYLKSGKSTPQ